MNDDELDQLIVARLRQRRGQDDRGETSGRTLSAADLAVFFNEPEPAFKTDFESSPRMGRSKSPPQRLTAGWSS
ncbi:MAG: hypothetical protein H0X28_04220 [Solirubrobacterales bacterium]|nr:hypothetical protein [Solirubrobacterales bacterium]